MNAMHNPTSTERPKKVITIRLDADIVEWFKATGRGYQTRINGKLREAIPTRQLTPSDADSKPVYNHFEGSLGR